MRCLLFVLAATVLSTTLVAPQGRSFGHEPREASPPTAPAPREKPGADARDHPARADEEKQIRAILAADNPTDAAAGYRTLFAGVGDDDLRRLQAHPSNTIALQAAWEQVERTVPERPEGTVRPDRDRLAWFLGFVEGRARVQAPRWWAEALLDSRANRRGNVYAGGLNLREVPGANPKVGGPPQTALRLEGGKPLVRVGTDSAPLPADFREKVEPEEAHERAAALIAPDRCYVAMHEDVGYGYRVARVDRAPLGVRWASDVWGSSWGSSSGLHRQWVEVTEQGDQVVVFGMASTAFHVEAFRADTGASTFRFSNSYSPW